MKNQRYVTQQTVKPYNSNAVYPDCNNITQIIKYIGITSHCVLLNFIHPNLLFNSSNNTITREIRYQQQIVKPYILYFIIWVIISPK